MKFTLPFFSLLVLLLSSCAHVIKKDHGFKQTTAVTVNGAQVRSGLKPMGGTQGLSISAMVVTVGTGSTDGPFLWRVEAEGKEGVHEWLRVNKVRVTTQTTKRDEWYPAKNLGVNAPFKKDPFKEGVSFAQYQIPGRLTVMPREDGKVKLHLNVSVKANGKIQSRWIKIELDPESSGIMSRSFYQRKL